MRATKGAQIAQRIGTAAHNSVAHARAQAVADKLRQCAECENVWHAENVHNEAGELYEANGVSFACGERLCPSCIANRSRVARKKAREGLARAGRRREDFPLPYHIILTIPKMRAAESSLINSLQLLLHTWRLFTKEDFYSEYVRAGIKGVEFTLGDEEKLKEAGREWSADVDGWHPHIHFLVIARKWIPANETENYDPGLRDVWTECYERACEVFGITPEINSSDGRLNVKLLYVTRDTKRKTRSTIKLESAIIEVAKYITKLESWLKIPESELLAIANIERWPRMFEVIGCARDGCGCGLCCDTGATGGASCHGSAERYLDTKNLSVSENPRAGPIRPPPKRGKALREVGREMIERGERDKWLVMLAAYAEKIQGFRREQLARRYPYATFRTLGGRVWYGINASAASLDDASMCYATYLEHSDYKDTHAQEISSGIDEARAAWSELVETTDRAEFKRVIDWQERERWFAYINHGDVTLQGDETPAARSRWNWQKPDAGSHEENMLRIARMFQWQLAGKRS
jgi:hypothetical protein